MPFSKIYNNVLNKHVLNFIDYIIFKSLYNSFKLFKWVKKKN